MIESASITVFSASVHENRVRDLWKTGKLKCPCSFEKYTSPEKLGPGTILLLDVELDEDLQAMRHATRANAAVLAVLTNPERLRALLREDFSAMLLPGFSKEEVYHALWKTIRHCVEKHDPKKFSTDLEVIRNSYRKIDSPEHPKRMKNYSFLLPAAGEEIPSVLLTKHEVGLLTALAKGKLYKEIACDFNITVGTVKQNLHRIYDKIKVGNKVEAINFLHGYQLG